MAYVSVPKDLKKIKTKIIFNLTKRQLVCFSIATVISLVYWNFIGDAISTTAKVYSLMLIISPAVLAGIYEKDGLTLEKYLKYRYETEFKNSKLRIYKSTNLYTQIIEDTGGSKIDSRSAKKKAKKEISSRKK